MVRQGPQQAVMPNVRQNIRERYRLRIAKSLFNAGIPLQCVRSLEACWENIWNCGSWGGADHGRRRKRRKRNWRSVAENIGGQTLPYKTGPDKAGRTQLL